MLRVEEVELGHRSEREHPGDELRRAVVQGGGDTLCEVPVEGRAGTAVERAAERVGATEEAGVRRRCSEGIAEDDGRDIIVEEGLCAINQRLKVEVDGQAPRGDELGVEDEAQGV